MAKIRKSGNEEVSYWLSYSDMMAALLLVFALIISLTAYQSRKQYEIKQAKIMEQEEIIEKLVGVKSDIIDLKYLIIAPIKQIILNCQKYFILDGKINFVIKSVTME